MKNMDKNRYFQIRSGKYIKTKVTDIQRLYSRWLWLVTVVYKPLLADAKLREDFAEDFVSADFSCDAAEGAECFAKVLREQVGG